ncbi:MAG: hypothetical protein ABIH36_02885 [bacterium]
METAEKATPEAVEGQPDTGRYKYVIEKTADDVLYRNTQADRAVVLEKVFEGEKELPKPFLDDIDDGRFFVKGRDRQRSGAVKSLIPERYFGGDGVEARKEVNNLLRSLREGKPLKEVVKESWADKQKLVALKLVGARLLQEHRPETQGKKWQEMSEEEKRTMRVAEMMIHAAEMGALREKADNKSLDEKTARVFAGNFSCYARSVDIPQEQRSEYLEVARLLGGKEIEPTRVDTVVESRPAEGERTVKEIEDEMRIVYGQIQKVSEAGGSGALSERVRARRQPEINRLRQRWQELSNELHTRVTRKRLRGATIGWLEEVEKELGRDTGISSEEALDWAEEHDWEERGRVEREEKKRKAAPYVKRGKKLKPLRRDRKL